MQVSINRRDLSSKPERIYKYMDFNGAVNLLKNGCIKFSNPQAWATTDPYETKVVSGKYRFGNGKCFPFPLKDDIYVSCFTEQYSCEAQWKSYAKQGSKMPCIQFQFNMQKLIDAIESTGAMMVYGKVAYYETNSFCKAVCDCFSSNVAKSAFLNISKGITMNRLKYVAKPLLVKRMAFAYENEWRFMLTADDVYDPYGLVYIPNLLDAVERIIIGPCSDASAFNKVKDELTTLTANHNITIQESYIRKQSKGVTIFNID